MRRQKTVGIRIPDSAVALALVRRLEHPLISTSAATPGGRRPHRREGHQGSARPRPGAHPRRRLQGRRAVVGDRPVRPRTGGGEGGEGRCDGSAGVTNSSSRPGSRVQARVRVVTGPLRPSRYRSIPCLPSTPPSTSSSPTSGWRRVSPRTASRPTAGTFGATSTTLDGAWGSPPGKRSAGARSASTLPASSAPGSPPARRRGRSRPFAVSTGCCWRSASPRPTPPTRWTRHALRGALPELLSRDEVERLLQAPEARTAAGLARPGHAGAALRHRAARHGARLAPAQRRGSRGPRAPGARQGEQGAAGAGGRAGGRGGEGLPGDGAGAAPARAPLEGSLRHAARTAAHAPGLREAPRPVRPGGRHPPRHLAAQAAPLVRDPPPRRAAPTCGRSRPCSGTPTSPPRRSTPTSIAAT